MNDEEKQICLALAALFIGVMIARVMVDVALMINPPSREVVHIFHDED